MNRILSEKGIIKRDDQKGCYTLSYIDKDDYDMYDEYRSIKFRVEYSVNNKIYKQWDSINYRVVLKQIYPNVGNSHPMYRRCANGFSVNLMGAGNFRIQENPNRSYKCNCGEVSITPRGEVIITPDSVSQRCILEEYKGDLFIDSISIPIIDIPLPNLEIIGGGRRGRCYSMGIPDTMKTVRIKIIPDEEFASYVPKDARFMCTKVRYSIIRDKKVVLEREVNAQSTDLIINLDGIRKGDYLQIEAKEVIRKNYYNEEIPFYGVADLIVPIF